MFWIRRFANRSSFTVFTSQIAKFISAKEVLTTVASLYSPVKLLNSYRIMSFRIWLSICHFQLYLERTSTTLESSWPIPL